MAVAGQAGAPGLHCEQDWKHLDSEACKGHPQSWVRGAGPSVIAQHPRVLESTREWVSTMLQEHHALLTETHAPVAKELPGEDGAWPSSVPKTLLKCW